MSNILNSEDFGLKIYNRFPPKYREDDVGQNYALKRYLQALSDGGFKYSIDEINGITYLIDPEKADSEVLPILFKQYGLDIFNGIPEEYLRYLLPKLGEAWSKKGSLSVVEFITSSLSGVRTSTEVSYDDKDNPIVAVKFEMDYSIGDYFPDAEQFKKMLVNFLPFYSDLNFIYTYTFHDNKVLNVLDEEDITTIHSTKTDSMAFRLRKDKKSESSSILGEAILGKAVLGVVSEEVDTFKDHISCAIVKDTGTLNSPIDTFTNKGYNTLNNSFFTNGGYNYSIITVGGTTEVVFN